jgi:hypothetical protein
MSKREAASVANVSLEPAYMIPCPALAEGLLRHACEAQSGQMCRDRGDGLYHPIHQERRRAWANLTELQRIVARIHWEKHRG